LSPFELAESIDSGALIDWNTTWKRLGRTDAAPEFPHCGDPRYSPCSTELISVPKPPQVILLLQNEWHSPDFYLRFMKLGDAWQFAGYYIAPLKYYPRRHEMIRPGGKPFLEVSVQGEGGTGLTSEIAEWFDLSLPSFDPVFSFPVRGSRSMELLKFNREVFGSASEDRTSGMDAIRLGLMVRFALGRNHLGELSFTGTYERLPGKTTYTLSKASLSRGVGSSTPIPNREFERMTQMERGPSIERLVSYVLPGLKELAAGSDVEAKQDLRAFLEECRDIPEKRELLALLRER
jgi:hypothetical protein